MISVEIYNKDDMPLVNTSARNSTYSIQQQVLSKVQLELIKLYSTNLNEHELLELKNILVHYFIT